MICESLDLSSELSLQPVTCTPHELDSLYTHTRRNWRKRERERERDVDPFAHEVWVADGISENGTELLVMFASIFKNFGPGRIVVKVVKLAFPLLFSNLQQSAPSSAASCRYFNFSTTTTVFTCTCGGTRLIIGNPRRRRRRYRKQRHLLLLTYIHSGRGRGRGGTG